ncbi:hypothetical protein D3C86_1880550 [compost metagenome]
MTPSSPPVRMVVFSGPHSALLIRPSGPDMLILMSFVCSSLFAATSTMCNAAGTPMKGSVEITMCWSPCASATARTGCSNWCVK